MTRENRYLPRVRISEKKFREFLRVFALDLTAAQIAKSTGMNRNAVNRLCRIAREKIAEHCEAQSPFRGTVEVDESYFGPRRVRGKRGRGAGRKTIVFGILKEEWQGLYAHRAQRRESCFAPYYQAKSAFRQHDPFRRLDGLRWSCRYGIPQALSRAPR